MQIAKTDVFFIVLNSLDIFKPQFVSNSLVVKLNTAMQNLSFISL